MRQNLILQTDSYKLTHHAMYPPGTKHVYSYLEARAGAQYPFTVFFGLQYLLKEYLEGSRVTQSDVTEAFQVAAGHFGVNHQFNKDWATIAQEGGRLPIRIRAVAEGAVVPVGNVLLTIENTDPRFPWLTNALESLIFKVWYPTTVATVSYWIRQTLVKNYGVDPSFMLHDFGYRGVSSEESAMMGGAAHLLSFMGTDTLPAMRMLHHYYGAPMVSAYSVAASEHSVMTSEGPEGELGIALRIIAQNSNAIVSLVADSYNYYKFVDAMIANKEIVDRYKVKLVIRPDSTTAEHPTPESLVVWTLKRQLEKFGKIHYNVLWGDGIDPYGIIRICDAVEREVGKEYVQNLVFGMGGGLLQKVNRDTQRFAIKCSAQFRDDKWIDISKNPLDASKKSKAGRLALVKGAHGPMTVPYEQSLGGDMLHTVYENGVITKQYTWDQIHRRNG